LATNQKTGKRQQDALGRRSREEVAEGAGPPPKNSSVATQPTVIMLAYSAMKNMANFMELYSVW
jgi:hypothetical protein